jgi:hypothetical protein
MKHSIGQTQERISSLRELALDEEHDRRLRCAEETAKCASARASSSAIASSIVVTSDDARTDTGPGSPGAKARPGVKPRAGRLTLGPATAIFREEWDSGTPG